MSNARCSAQRSGFNVARNSYARITYIDLVTKECVHISPLIKNVRHASLSSVNDREYCTHKMNGYTVATLIVLANTVYGGWWPWHHQGYMVPITSTSKTLQILQSDLVLMKA